MLHRQTNIEAISKFRQLIEAELIQLQKELVDCSLRFTSLLIGIELTLKELDELQKALDPSAPKPLSSKPKEEQDTLPHPAAVFFEKHWKRIRGTDLAYTNATKSPLHLAYLELAEHFAPQLKTDRYSLLMPTIKMKESIFTTQLSDPTLELWQFILDDNDERFIEVFSCLKSAEESGVLLHQAIDAKKEEKLTGPEQDRLIHHSDMAFRYYSAIMETVQVKERGVSIGSEIDRLCQRLMEGGAHRQGTVFAATAESYHGVQEFYNYLQTLVPDEQKTIFDLSSPHLTVANNFQIIWFHLLMRADSFGYVKIKEDERKHVLEELDKPENGNMRTQIPCVELYAGNIKSILHTNPLIYETYPKNIQSSERALSVLRKQRDTRGEAFRKALEDKTYEVRASYGEASYDRLPRQVFSDATAINLVIKKGYIRDLRDLICFIKNCPEENSIRLLEELGGAFLRPILNRQEEINTVQGLLSAENKPILLNLLGDDHCLKCQIPHIGVLFQKLEEIKEADQQTPLLTHLERERLQKLITSRTQLTTVLSAVDDKNRLLTELGANHIVTIIRGGHSLGAILTNFPECQETLLTILNPRDQQSYLQGVIPTIEELGFLLLNLPASRQRTFLTTLPLQDLTRLFLIENVQAVITAINAVQSAPIRKELFFGLAYAYRQQRSTLGLYTSCWGCLLFGYDRGTKIKAAIALENSIQRNAATEIAGASAQGTLGTIARAY